MKFSLRSLLVAIPMLTLAAGGPALAAQEGYKQKVISCGGDLKKIVSVQNNRIPEILFIIMSASNETTVKVNFGSNRILQTYMDANSTFQTSLAEIAGNPGAAIRVGCSGNGELALTLYYSLSAAK